MAGVHRSLLLCAKLLVWALACAGIIAAPFDPARAESAPKVSIVPNIGSLGRFEAFFDKYSRAVFSPDAQVVALINFEKGIKVWDVKSGRLLRTLQYPTFFLDAAFTPDGTLLITSHKDGEINLWDLMSDKPVAILRDTVTAPDGATPDDFAIENLIIQPSGSHAGRRGFMGQRLRPSDEVRRLHASCRLP